MKKKILFLTSFVLCTAALSADPVQDEIQAKKRQDARVEKQAEESDIQRRARAKARVEQQIDDDARYRRELEDKRWNDRRWEEQHRRR